jgi:hypothetical protein
MDKTVKQTERDTKDTNMDLFLFLSRFYPYILIASSICLFITLIIYTAYPKLLNHYTRIMRHFTLSMMLAFIILSINQLTPVANYSMNLCRLFGRTMLNAQTLY